jgi:hypothetical protein
MILKMLRQLAYFCASRYKHQESCGGLILILQPKASASLSILPTYLNQCFVYDKGGYSGLPFVWGKLSLD